jgi:hypothetical protein
MTYTLEIRVKLVNQKNSCGDIEFNNFFVRDLVQILDECAKAVAIISNISLKRYADVNAIGRHCIQATQGIIVFLQTKQGVLYSPPPAQTLKIFINKVSGPASCDSFSRFFQPSRHPPR